MTVVADATRAAGEVRRADPLPSEPRTELGYARRLVHAYGDRLRYVVPWRRWLVWDGVRWTPDTTGQAVRWMKTIARAVTTDAKGAESKRGESSGGIAGAMNLASTEPGIAVAPDQLDADPLLLNTPTGTLDLRTGELRPHDRADLLTKVTAAGYRPDAKGPTWAAFLARVQPEADMRTYLARLLGHALEGRQRVHVLPIFHGVGANGKSTLVNAVTAALGDYAGPADPNLLFARTTDGHPTAVADLFGRRLAVLHEGDANRRLAEGTVKRLTGGDTIKARRMREDFWSFTPSHTFLMLTNHTPIVAGRDEGIWRRLRLVPFAVTVPPHERDEQLPDKLALEADAVLAWLVAGYQDWHRNGLNEPVTVTAATDAYRADSDVIARFLAECCQVAKASRVRSSELYQAWQAWCAHEGEDPGTNKALTTELQHRGYDTVRTNKGATWKGIGLTSH